MRIYMVTASTVRCYTDRVWVVSANSDDEARKQIGEYWNPNSFSLSLISSDAVDITEPGIILFTGCNRDVPLS